MPSKWSSSINLWVDLAPPDEIKQEPLFMPKDVAKPASKGNRRRLPSVGLGFGHWTYIATVADRTEAGTVRPTGRCHGTQGHRTLGRTLGHARRHVAAHVADGHGRAPVGRSVQCVARQLDVVPFGFPATTGTWFLVTRFLLTSPSEFFFMHLLVGLPFWL